MKTNGLRYLTILLSLAVIGLHGRPLQAVEKLAIYFPTVVVSKEIQKTFEADPALKEFKVLAFSRFEDFQSAIENEAFDYILVPSAYTKYYKDVEPIYQLIANGKSSFRYQVISLDPTWNAEKISDGTVGVVNLIGREKTKFLVDELLENKKFKRIKQVSKFADLYPLLALGNANYAIFTPSDLDIVKTEFSSKPIHVVSTVEVPYPILCMKSPKVSKSFEIFAKLRPSTLKVLGMDSLRYIKK